jgi:hypothetical protein
MKAALVDIATGKVENVIILPDDYDSKAKGAYIPPKGFKLETTNADSAKVGGKLVNGVWQDPPNTQPQPTISLQQQIDNLTTLLASKGTLSASDVANVKKPSTQAP